VSQAWADRRGHEAGQHLLRLPVLIAPTAMRAGVLRQEAFVARGDESCGLGPRSSMQERRKVLDTPGIVDHQQAAPIIERVRQLELGGVEGAEARTGAVENLDEIGDAADQIVGPSRRA
jgi:hypothetical protein